MEIATLYNELRAHAQDHNRKSISWDAVDSSLKRSKLPLEQRQTIYMLILEHHFRTEQYGGLTPAQIGEAMKSPKGKLLPYNGEFIDRKSKRGVRINLTELPEILREILNVYLSACLET
jgi:hypothetical protein